MIGMERANGGRESTSRLMRHWLPTAGRGYRGCEALAKAGGLMGLIHGVDALEILQMAPWCRAVFLTSVAPSNSRRCHSRRSASSIHRLFSLLFACLIIGDRHHTT